MALQINLIQELLTMIDEDQEQEINKTSSQDKIGCEQGQYRKKHILSTLKRYLSELKDATDHARVGKIIILDGFLIEDPILEKTILSNLGLKKILDQAWLIRNHFVENSDLSPDQKTLLDTNQIRYKNRELVNILNEYLKVLNPAKSGQQLSLMQQPNWMQPAIQKKNQAREKISIELTKIRDLILQGDGKSALQNIEELNQFMQDNISNANNTLTTQILNKIKLELMEIYSIPGSSKIFRK